MNVRWPQAFKRFKHDSRDKDDWDFDACSLLKSKKRCDHKVAHLMRHILKKSGPKSDQISWFTGEFRAQNPQDHFSSSGPRKAD